MYAIARRCLCAIVFFGSVISAAGAQPDDTTLHVGVIPSIAVAPLYLGVSKGFFKAEGLTIEPVAAKGGAAIVPALLSNDLQIGLSNTVSLILAASRGIPVEAVNSAIAIVPDTHHRNAAVLVTANGPIKTIKDLEGKTIAVNTLNNIGDLTIKDDLARRGVNVATIKFVEIGFNEMPAALQAGRVDAVWENEPYLTPALDGGARILFNSFENFPNLTVAVYVTTHEFARRNAGVVERFRRAMSRSQRYAFAHQDEAQAALAIAMKTDRGNDKRMALSGWMSTINSDSLTRLQNVMIRFGLINNPIDFPTVFPPAAISGR